ncbi:MAG: T9SS type A sorting domain-containing protein, partial [candidate division KSB1 bacterium]|nr:T9SS type A sorting domain-containing protein [candidate division KSB1 bacterium]
NYLQQNCPNPFNSVTEISYQLLQASHVTLAIYDLLGRELRTLIDGEQTGGKHLVRWNGEDANGQPLASGIYICRLKAGSFVSSRKLLLVR